LSSKASILFLMAESERIGIIGLGLEFFIESKKMSHSTCDILA
jgi:hypothetical protein